MRCVRSGGKADVLAEPVDQPFVVVGEAGLLAQADKLVDVVREVELVTRVGQDDHVPVGADTGLGMVETGLRNPDQPFEKSNRLGDEITGSPWYSTQLYCGIRTRSGWVLAKHTERRDVLPSSRRPSELIVRTTEDVYFTLPTITGGNWPA